MKRLVLILAALLVGAAAFSASAQLKVTGSSEGAEQLTTLSPAWSWLYKMNGEYFISIKSSNQFDPYFWLDLGPDKETAIETLNSLLDALNAAKNGEHLHIESVGEKFMLTRETMLGAAFWMITAVDTKRSYAGHAQLDAMAIRKGLKYLDK